MTIPTLQPYPRQPAFFSARQRNDPLVSRTERRNKISSRCFISATEARSRQKKEEGETAGKFPSRYLIGTAGRNRVVGCFWAELDRVGMAVEHQLPPSGRIDVGLGDQGKDYGRKSK